MGIPLPGILRRGILVAAAAAVLTVVPARDAGAVGTPLTPAEIQLLIDRTVHFARRVAGADPLSIAVVDVEGNSLGVFHMNGSLGCRSVVLAKAATASYFSSDQQSFTTRTAAFIIQDHFPPGVRFQGAGPLYGVEFSSLAASDVNPVYFPGPAPGALCLNEPSDVNPLPEGAQARVRGELGAVALFKNGKRVGALAVDDGGDNRITIPTGGILIPGERYRLTHGNLENGRRLEKVVQAAARPFLPPAYLRSNTILVGGIRLPFAKGSSLKAGTIVPVVPGLDGDFDIDYPARDPSTLPSRFTPLTINPPPSAGPGADPADGSRPVAYPIIAGTDGFLSVADVQRLLWQGARAAGATRAAIRRPIGLAMQCWVSVVDTKGEVLGVYRTPDATLFSYDVAVQKARTAVLFSDAQAAWSSRAVGLFAQGFYPAGQQQKGVVGPLFQLQDGISVGLLFGELGAPADGRFRNGITIFPGGVPLYRNGVLVGGVGVSGDGVDQDDLAADAASDGFGAPGSIRCDFLGEGQIRGSLGRALDRLDAAAPAGPPGTGLDFFREQLNRCRTRLSNMTLDVGPSYVKLPRHPGPVTVR